MPARTSSALLVHDRLGHDLRGSVRGQRQGHVRRNDTLFADDAEGGDANWIYAAPWQRNDGTQTFTHNFYLQWRNVNATGGYDSALGDSRWRFGPANTGLLVWYNNNFYTDNEIFNYLTDYPSFGAQGPHAGSSTPTTSRTVTRTR